MECNVDVVVLSLWWLLLLLLRIVGIIVVTSKSSFIGSNIRRLGNDLQTSSQIPKKNLDQTR